jgi:hypothetical protein
MEWLTDVTPPQQQALQAPAPGTDGCSTEELLLLQQPLQDNQLVKERIQTEPMVT